MPDLYIIPTSFFYYRILFYAFCIITTTTVGILSFRVYSLSSQEKSKYFGLAFFSFAVAYIIQFILSMLTLLHLRNPSISVINKILELNEYSIYAHAIFFTLGLLILVSAVFKKKPAFEYIPFFLILAVFVYRYDISLFSLVASALFLYSAIFYFQNYSKNKNKKTLLVFLAFLFLFVTHIHFILSENHAIFLLIGNILEVVAYILIAINLGLIKNAGKKKQT